LLCSQKKLESVSHLVIFLPKKKEKENEKADRKRGVLDPKKGKKSEGGGNMIFNHVKRGVYSVFCLIQKHAHSTERRREREEGEKRRRKRRRRRKKEIGFWF